MDKKTKYWLAGLGAGVVVLGVLLYVYRKQVKDVLGGYKWFDDTLKWYRDAKTKKIVENLHPKARMKFKDFISRVEKELGYQIIATSGYRTWEHQAQLHKENSKNAKAGYSSHNYGFALDINVLDENGKTVLRKSSSDKSWNDSGIVRIAKDMGFKWGGDFKDYHDPIHFYLEPLDREEMRQRYLAGEKDTSGYIAIKTNEEKVLVA